MVKDAEAHAEDDKTRRELAEARNQAEALVHSTEKSLAEFGDKVGPAEKGAIETAPADLKGVKAGEDLAELKAKTASLPQASLKLGEPTHKAPQQPARAG